MSGNDGTPPAESMERVEEPRGRSELKIGSELAAYHDRELSWWRRRRVEAGLRRSLELRQELEALRQMRSAAAAAEGPLASPDLWGAISRQLAAVDAERGTLGGARAEGSPRTAAGAASLLGGLGRLLEWRPIGLAVAAGVTALAIGIWNTSGTVPEGFPTDEPVVGVLRYLDTGGRSVMVLDNEDVTIIWLMEG